MMHRRPSLWIPIDFTAIPVHDKESITDPKLLQQQAYEDRNNSTMAQLPVLADYFCDGYGDSFKFHSAKDLSTKKDLFTVCNNHCQADVKNLVRHEKLSTSQAISSHKGTTNNEFTASFSVIHGEQLSPSAYQPFNSNEHDQSESNETGIHAIEDSQQNCTSFAKSANALNETQLNAPAFIRKETTANSSALDRAQNTTTLERSIEPIVIKLLPTKPTALSGNKEKKINKLSHIASEQKRRNVIRSGFKDLTDIIPILRNTNNSKSAILFKAVDYIKYLGKRNQYLRDRIARLQLRLSLVKKSAIVTATTTASAFQMEDALLQGQYWLNNASNSYWLRKQQAKHTEQNMLATDSTNGQLPLDTIAALMVHKNQQKQLQELQEQLRMQRYLLNKHRIPIPDNFDRKTEALLTNDDDNFSKTHYNSYKYESIPIPSRRSSGSS
ncbi:hypothetical protein BDF20DRAFT_85753 [Mycotypha africana]|uniref:uncharacterized protein n=1 Tax=Mycotypha africana TaxID=64632 RepID=UPI002300A5F4|nr:uncharacterized protein BDF20DRAFT_85753 [Mycotypha africana]KAI8992078.1 hypothetical protein BDF20DRAFT_85753 [Mycotypha africana]